MSAQDPLQNLLPTTKPLPAQLVQLSSSLLAQSRNRASNLKPEEEIARPHACAEIACRRLRAQLRLPPTTGRPPCKPAVYKKLLGFLDGLLDAGEQSPKKSTTTKTTTPKKRNADGQPNVTSTRVSVGAKSSKKQAFAGKIDHGPSQSGSEEAPDVIMPLIRKLCKSFSTPLLPPHVYTGACVVLKLAALWPRSSSSMGKAKEDSEAKFRDIASALTIALFFMVLTRMQQGRITTDVFRARCVKAVEAAGLAASEEATGEVEEWIKKINTEGWCRGQDWWDSVPEDVMDEDSVLEGGEEEIVQDEIMPSRSRKRRERQLDKETEEDPEGILLPGLGTMMQDAVDWLSEERRLHYLEWKDEMVDKIKMLEKGKSRPIAVR